jgi:hypothetical protein
MGNELRTDRRPTRTAAVGVRRGIPYRDETATTPVPPAEDETARIERRGACMSVRLALVFLSPRVG